MRWLQINEVHVCEEEGRVHTAAGSARWLGIDRHRPRQCWAAHTLFVFDRKVDGRGECSRADDAAERAVKFRLEFRLVGRLHRGFVEKLLGGVVEDRQAARVYQGRVG